MATMLAILPPEEKPDSLFLTLFLDRMPQSIREHLAARNFATLRDMGYVALYMNVVFVYTIVVVFVMYSKTIPQCNSRRPSLYKINTFSIQSVYLQPVLHSVSS